MINEDIHISILEKNQLAPFDLLLTADPNRTKIEDYLMSGECYVLKIQNKVKGVIVLEQRTERVLEIVNIAVEESVQGRGLGKLLLRFAEKQAIKQKYEKLQIGTGNSSINQLALYQKMGFEIKDVFHHFFTKNYPSPIYENGIQCRHMILLEKQLTY
ncbi:GNAT family N-acetyltransferase [Crocinitomix algicola]|uniref:GNAT family N-acetyltransferase n=1 Tax=Crocinitomix algicola TaxID=1740263 RepID=UPI001FDFE5BC|nr:GNAT family N-acetyltransferase [Crocinitomix algicola]